jgi:hypothetical protein
MAEIRTRRPLPLDLISFTNETDMPVGTRVVADICGPAWK